MTPELLENYRYWRARGRTAASALSFARIEIKAGKRRYGACEPSIKYNPLTKDGARWVENVENGLRRIGFVDEICRYVTHQGWWTNEFQDEKLRGIVYRLPHGRYAYGYDNENNEGSALLVFAPIGTELSEAVLWADRMAESAAEKEREYNEAWQKGRDYYERLPEDIKEARGRFLKLTTLKPRGEMTVRWLTELAEEWCNLRSERRQLLADWGHMPGFEE